MGLPLSYNWRNVWRRKSRTGFTILGISLAIFISLMMLALASGIRGSIQNSAEPDNVLVLSKGAETLEFSAIDRQILDAVRFSEAVAEQNGERLASPEVYFTTTAEVPDSAPAQGLIRGVLPVALQIHRQVRISEGQFPSNPGEIMLGPLVATKLGVQPDALQIGKEIRFEGQRWRIVGHFAAPGTALESEIWGPLDDIMVTARREEFSVIAVKAKSPGAVQDMVFDFSTRRDILADARSEIDYYRAYADSFRPVEVMATLMTGMLIIGGIITGMNTFLAAVLGRVREIGMLRTLGYTKRAVLVSFALEALLTAFSGGILGSLLALTLNGLPMLIPMGAFRFQVNFQLVTLGLALAALIGLLGVAWPIFRATRVTIVNAIRQL
jgi:ABC-type lipoprotein release transport system permease subunit